MTNTIMSMMNMDMTPMVTMRHVNTAGTPTKKVVTATVDANNNKVEK